MRDFTRKTVNVGSLAIACILHALALAEICPPTVSSAERPAENVDAFDLETVDISLEPPLPRPSSNSSVHAAERAASSARSSVVDAIAEEIGAGAAHGNEIAPPVDSASPAVHEDLPKRVGEPWIFSPTGNVDLGLGDKTGALARQMAQKGELDSDRRPSAGRVVEGLDALDVQRGLGRGGPVVQAVEEVAHDPEAPPEGVAMFDIAIEKNGRVFVSVSETTANREDWQRLTADIAEAVQKKSVRLPEGADGLRVGVRVEAKIRFPDGRDPKKSGAYAASSGIGVHEKDDGQVELELPSVGVGVRGKVCNAGISLTVLGPMIGGGCSPENMGTHAERTVGATETYEKRM